jgi:hypothetical protein
MDAGFASVVCAMNALYAGEGKGISTSVWTISLAYPRRGLSRWRGRRGPG